MSAAVYGSVVRPLERALRAHPDLIAVIDGERRISYRQLYADVARIAGGLTDLGVKPETRIGMLFPNSYEFVATLLGIWASNATYVQMSALGGPRDFSRNLARVDAEVVLYDARYDPTIAAVRDNLPTVRTYIRYGDSPDRPSGTLNYQECFGKEQPRWPLRKPQPDQIASIMFTSGTTGEPKPLLIQHDNWSHYQITSALEVAEMREGTRFVHAAPMSHLSISFIVPTLLRAGTNITLNGFDASQFVSAVKTLGADTTALVPTMIYSLLDDPSVTPEDLSSLYTVVYAGSPISPARLKEAITLFGGSLVQYYGGTEQGFVSKLTKADHRTIFQTDRLLAAGQLLHHVEMKIVDDDGAEVPAGSEGEIVTRSHSQLTRCSDVELTQQTLHDGWVHTGDIGRVDEDGYLFVIDRKKEMIISGGLNIFPRQIEDVLLEHPEVREAAVFGVPDDRWGEAVMAVVVLHTPAAATEEDLKKFVASVKGSASAPKRVEFADSIPRTQVGKVDKRVLKAPYWSGRERRVN